MLNGGSDAVFSMMREWENRAVLTVRYKLIRNFAPQRSPRIPVDYTRSGAYRPDLVRE